MQIFEVIREMAMGQSYNDVIVSDGEHEYPIEAVVLDNDKVKIIIKTQEE